MPDQMTLKDLLVAWRDGTLDKTAETALVRHVERVMASYLRAYGAPDKDVMQATWERLLSRLPDFDPAKCRSGAQWVIFICRSVVTAGRKQLDAEQAADWHDLSGSTGTPCCPHCKGKSGWRGDVLVHRLFYGTWGHGLDADHAEKERDVAGTKPHGIQCLDCGRLIPIVPAAMERIEPPA